MGINLFKLAASMEFWQFNYLSGQPWDLIHSNASLVLGGPSTRTGHRLIGNRASGKIVVLFGFNRMYQIISFTSPIVFLTIFTLAQKK
jgi:hypothetical protein